MWNWETSGWQTIHEPLSALGVGQKARHRLVLIDKQGEFSGGLS